MAKHTKPSPARTEFEPFESFGSPGVVSSLPESKPKTRTDPTDVQEPKSWAEMVAEGLREIGELLVAFGFLDALLHDVIRRPDEQVAGPKWFVGIFAVGLAVWLVGAFIERRRK
jgi:hypothetical protein